MMQEPQPELSRVLEAMPQAAASVVVGILTAIGQMLQSKEPITTGGITFSITTTRETFSFECW